MAHRLSQITIRPVPEPRTFNGDAGGTAIEKAKTFISEIEKMAAVAVDIPMQMMVQIVLVDEYDAIKPADAVTFTGDADETAIKKAAEFIATLDEKISALDEIAIDNDSQPQPNRAMRRAAVKKKSQT